MNIDHVHFYVTDAKQWRDWFIQHLGFTAVGAGTTPDTHTELLQCGPVLFLVSSPLNSQGAVAAYLERHPPGIADVAFQVQDVCAALGRALANGALLDQPLQSENQPQGQLQWGQIQGWGSLHHTLLQRTGKTSLVPQGWSLWREPLPTMMPLAAGRGTVHSHQLGFTNIDHIVLNVEHQTLNTAVRWYQAVLGFHANGWFDIKTDRSALRSQVLVHPQGSAQFPINEPASSGSQIQEFLAANRGPGIQHLALGTLNIVATITHLRQQGLSFLKVPHSYYTQLNQSCPPETPPLDWQAIEQQQILVDLRNPTGILMQAFTHPIFGEPTFFLELIERRSQAQGFGEGNFLALFEAIEREQLKRGSLV